MLDTNLMSTKFEDFIKTHEGEDIFGKIYRVDDVLSSDVLTGNEALGALTMDKVQAKMVLREKDNSFNEVLMLGTNSYLNLTTHPNVINSAKIALEKFGYGMGAVSNYAGITDLHRELEIRIAKFYKTEDAILFSSGYGTNVGVISALCGENDVIINDSANHASIFDGCRLSGAQIKVYPHGNMKYLERILSNLPKETTGRLIITDGVFSMDGDIAKLNEICDLAEAYNCKVMVDDAHGLGIVGKTGRGSAEFHNVMDRIDINVGMLSKTAGGLGGFCTGKKELIQYLRLYARTYFFSTALPAPIVGGLIEVFKLLESDNAGREELWNKICYAKLCLQEKNLDIGHSQSAIIPIMIYDEAKLFKIHKSLREQGIYTNIVTYPAVRRKECRLRVCIMKDLSYQLIDNAVEIISNTIRRFQG